MTYTQGGFSLNGNQLTVAGIGKVKVFLARPIEGEIKTCTIKRKADGWYVLFSVECPKLTVTHPTGETVGADLGVKTFMVLSTGEEVANPKFLRPGESKLKTAQRRVSRRKQGSSRRKKAVKLLAKKHQRVARQRRDFHFKNAKGLAERFAVIKFEDLNVKGLVKNHCLAKSISDAGWSQFISIVAHKAEEAGGQVIVVNPCYTSMTCSGCKSRQRIPLQVRVYRCGNCNLIIDRDYNAAINVKEKTGRTVRSGMRKVASSDELRTSKGESSLESPPITGFAV